MPISEDRDAFAATKLTRTEFAVVRAYAQGMRPVDIANRYLVDPDDDEALTEHQAIARILGLRDRLVQFARQHNRPDIAEMFDALRGRSDVGMSRRVDALSSLETLGQSTPMLGHEVHLWFSSSLAKRLSAAGIRHLSDLVKLANGRGSSWWRSVPRVGPKSAEIITKWLLNAKPIAGSRILEPYVMPPSGLSQRKTIQPQALGLHMAYPVPLEHMLPGQAATCLAMVKRWLASKQRESHTFKSYRREGERLLLWAAGQPLRLADMDEQALQRYEAFLANPVPTSFWCGPASPRDLAHWRPFEGPLQATSRAASLRVVLALLRFLHKTGHLHQKPTSASLLRPQPKPSEIGKHHIDSFLEWLGSVDTFQARAALPAALLVREGFKVTELPKMTHRDLEEYLMAETATSPESRQTPSPIKRTVSGKTLAALEKHWNARGFHTALPSTPLLAPAEYPPTRLGNAKRRLGAPQSYSASGLDQLLRSAWKAYVRASQLELPPFTPKQIRSAA